MFFELNGQPRSITVQDKSSAPQRARPPKAEEGNPLQVGAPMPGMVATVMVKPGQKVERGDAMFSLEAMKMETTIFADRSATVARIVTAPGTQVDTKDLLLEYAAG